MTSSAGWHRANDHDDGPFRHVEEVRASREQHGLVRRVDGERSGGSPIVAYREVLDCGHAGDYLGFQTDPTGDRSPWPAPSNVTFRSRTKRRCRPCRG